MVTVEQNEDCLGDVKVYVNDVETVFANSQDTVKVVVTPNTGIEIAQFQLGQYTTTGNGNPVSFTVNGTAGGAYTYTFTMPTTGVKAEITYASTQYGVDVNKTGNGTVTITDGVSEENKSQFSWPITLRIVPDEGYTIYSKSYSYNVQQDGECEL